MPASDPFGGDDDRVAGTVRRSARVPADEVPASSPLERGVSHALALGVELDDGRRVRAFEAWPTSADSRDRVARLLSALDRSASDLRALDGERVALVEDGGAFRVDVDATWDLQDGDLPSQGLTHAVAEIAVAAGLLTGLVGFFLWWTTFDALAVPLGALAAVGLAAGLGVDAWRTQTDAWNPRPVPWAVAGVVPVLNVAAGVAYLLRKAVAVNAPERADDTWRDALVADVAVFGAALALAAFDLTFGLGVTLLAHAWAFAPLAVFFDATVRNRTGDGPSRLAWTAGAAILGGAGGLVYRLRTAT